jgi:hypothetical protein
MMIEIFTTLVALFIFALLVTPIVLLTILVIRTNKPKNPTPNIKLEQLEQNDYNIVDDVNKAFHDVNQALNEINDNLNGFGKRLEDIEESLEKEAHSIKGFNQKR